MATDIMFVDPIKHPEWWDKKTEEPKAEEHKGSWLSKFFCAYGCQNYTDGFEYDEKTDKCQCKGTWRPPLMWIYKH